MILPTSMAAEVLFRLDDKPVDTAKLCTRAHLPKPKVEAMLRLLVANGWAREIVGDKEATYTVTEFGIVLRADLRKKLSEVEA